MHSIPSYHDPPDALGEADIDYGLLSFVTEEAVFKCNLVKKAS